MVAFILGTPSMWVVSLLSWVNSMGIPWWGAIAGVTFGLRLILLPFSISSTRQRLKLQEIQPELNKLMERARLSQSMGMAADAQNLRDEMLVASSTCLTFRTSTRPLAYRRFRQCSEPCSRSPWSSPASWVFADCVRQCLQ